MNLSGAATVFSPPWRVYLRRVLARGVKAGIKAVYGGETKNSLG